MNFGMTDTQWDQLTKNLIKLLKNQNLRIFIFGSRAKGKFHPYSDIDLLVDDLKSPILDKQAILLAMEHIENSNFPFKIDLVYRSQLAESYRSDVESSMIEI